MEVFEHTKLNELAFKAINQKGYGADIDRYIYSQSGEGLGSLLGNLFKKAVPFLGTAIKGAAKAAVPHLKEAGKAAGANIIKTGAERLSKRGSDELIEIIHKPHKRRKQGL